MSFPRDLDEYDEGELYAEIDFRLRRRRRGLCDYCGRRPNTPSCKFPARHLDAATPVSGEPERTRGETRSAYDTPRCGTCHDIKFAVLVENAHEILRLDTLVTGLANRARQVESVLRAAAPSSRAKERRDNE